MDIGFLEELFTPILQAEIVGRDRLTFAGVDTVRGFYCPAASLEATLNACANRLRSPLIVVQAALGYKKEEERLLDSLQGELIPASKPEAQLRVVSAVPNYVARAQKFSIPTRMRIPKGSVIAKVFHSATEFESMTASENLNWWRSSDGSGLDHVPIHVEAMRARDRVWAIIDISR